ncbi:MAG: RNA methyltransferase [Nitriliruptoraceae bacterium]
MPSLTSTRNPQVKQIADLKRRRMRRQHGKHLAEGPIQVLAAVAAGLVEQIVATEDGWQALQERATREQQRKLAALTRLDVASHVLDHVCDAQQPQGVAAVVRTTTAKLDDVVTAARFIVVDRINDPGNLGTIIRTASAFGIGDIVVTASSADPFGPKTVRASAGEIYRTRVCVDASADDVVRAAAGCGTRLVCLEARGTDTLAALRSASPTGLVIGSETHGVDERLLGVAGHTVAIPMPGGAESLNAAVAAAIALYEWSCP